MGQKGTGRARSGFQPVSGMERRRWSSHSTSAWLQPADAPADAPSSLAVRPDSQSRGTGIVVLEGMPLPEPKTRFMAQALNKLVGGSSTLILIPVKNEEYEMVIRSTNNIPDAKTLMASYLNIRDILSFDKIILPLESLDVIAANLG